MGDDIAPAVDGALSHWVQSMQKPEPGRVFRLLSGLWLSTSHEGLGEDDFRAKIKIYENALNGYPDDIVTDIIGNWSEQEGGQWFPALKQLLDPIRELTDKRMKLGDALKGWGKPDQIKKRVSFIRFDVRHAESGNTPKGCDVPDFITGLQGKKPSDAMPRYREWAEARIQALEAML